MDGASSAGPGMEAAAPRKNKAAETLAIFRTSAMEHCFYRKDEGALPEFLQYRFMGLLWLITLFTAGLVVVVWVQSTPHIVGATGFLVPDAARACGGAELVVLVPDTTSSLSVGQTIVCMVDGQRRVQGEILRVEPGLTTLERTRATYPFGTVDVRADQPLRLAHARLHHVDGSRHALAVQGACDVLITVGIRPLHSFLPLSISVGKGGKS